MFISNGIDIVNINREEFNNSNLPIKILSKIELEEFNKINDTNERKHLSQSLINIRSSYFVKSSTCSSNDTFVFDNLKI